MIRTEDLNYAVGSFRLSDASLEVADGEYFVLLGPPGSGKSVFLECLCGLNRVHGGRILIDGTEMTDWPPRKRNIGYVPQDYALFPHLSVEQNIAFGLRERGLEAKRMAERIKAAAETLGIGHLLRRIIPGLSGGERQRVALARALAIEPRVLLLDEPVSALDESTRERVCGELRALQQRLKITIVHVSHNLEEAFSVADRGGIMNEGRFQQIGPLQDLLRRPANEFVARFMRCENILRGHVIGPGPGGTLRVVAQGQEFLALTQHRGDIVFVVRPENVRLTRTMPSPDGPPVAAIPVQVIRAVDRGAYVRIELNGAVPLLAHVSPHDYAELGSPTSGSLLATVASDAIHVLQPSAEGKS